MPIDRAKLPKVMMIKAAQCETADELIELAKTDGFEITKAEAEAESYLAELEDFELDPDALDNVAGGGSGSCFYVPPNKQCNHAYGT